MPSIRRGTTPPPTKVMRNGAEIQRIMRGQQEMWSNQTNRILSTLSPTHWFQFRNSEKVDTVTGGAISDSSNKLQGRDNHMWVQYNSALPASFTLGSAPGPGVTMSAYFQHTGAARGQGEILMARGNYFDTGSSSIFIGISNSRTSFYYGLRLTGTNYTIRTTPASLPDDKQWHQVIVRSWVSASTVYWTVHLDGTVIDTFNHSIAKTFAFPSGDNLYFGSNHLNDANSFDGNMDDVMWFNRQLTVQEVDLLAAEPRTA